MLDASLPDHNQFHYVPYNLAVFDDLCMEKLLYLCSSRVRESYSTMLLYRLLSGVRVINSKLKKLSPSRASGMRHSPTQAKQYCLVEPTVRLRNP